MSEETKIFRGDHAPEEGRVEKAVPIPNTPVHVPLTAPAPEAAAATGEPGPVVAPASEPPAPKSAPPAPAPAPLDFHLDESGLFHTPEAVRQRMAQLATLAHSTAHLLDEQAEESERIARRLKSL